MKQNATKLFQGKPDRKRLRGSRKTRWAEKENNLRRMKKQREKLLITEEIERQKVKVFGLYR